MNENEPIILTRAGFEQLQRELADLETRGREEAAENLFEAADDTDVAEEETFRDAMNQKSMLEARILQLKQILAMAQVVDEDPDPNSASPGDRVVVWDHQEKAEVIFDLLGGAEIAMGRRHGVSIDSPVGKALLGKRIGDTIEVQTPDGVARYTIRRLEQIPG
ncbi:MAG: GreA/GreB family elongation factor [Chloroflexi bacterium]|nr:GreA/GreB family elongation factor [Chloroflexota bacterium]